MSKDLKKEKPVICHSCSESDLDLSIDQKILRCGSCGHMYEKQSEGWIAIEESQLRALGHRFNIGGVKFELGKKANFVDATNLKRKVGFRIRHYIEQKIMTVILGGVLLLFLLALLGSIAWYVMSQAPGARSNLSTSNSKKATVTTWDGTTPYVCKKGTHELKKMNINVTQGPAVIAKSNCVLTLVKPQIIAPIGILISGNAKVTLKGGRVEGKKYALDAQGNSKVFLKGAKIIGKVKTKNNAKIQ